MCATIFLLIYLVLCKSAQNINTFTSLSVKDVKDSNLRCFTFAMLVVGTKDITFSATKSKLIDRKMARVEIEPVDSEL